MTAKNKTALSFFGAKPKTVGLRYVGIVDQDFGFDMRCGRFLKRTGRAGPRETPTQRTPSSKIKYPLDYCNIFCEGEMIKSVTIPNYHNAVKLRFNFQNFETLARNCCSFCSFLNSRLVPPTP